MKVKGDFAALHSDCEILFAGGQKVPKNPLYVAHWASAIHVSLYLKDCSLRLPQEGGSRSSELRMNFSLVVRCKLHIPLFNESVR